MEILNALMWEADGHGVLSALLGNTVQYQALVYANDLVVFLCPYPQDVIYIQETLEHFMGASGLVTNLDKCLLSSIRCSEAEIAGVQVVFPCQLAPFLCRCQGFNAPRSSALWTLWQQGFQPRR